MVGIKKPEGVDEIAADFGGVILRGAGIPERLCAEAAAVREVFVRREMFGLKSRQSAEADFALAE